MNEEERLFKCPRCHQEKILLEFTKDKRIKSGYAVQCKKCKNKYDRTYRLNNRDRLNKEKREKYRDKNSGYYKTVSKYRYGRVIRALEIYDSKCRECDNDDIVVLEFHHKYGNKQKEPYRKLLNRILKANDKLDDIQCLCANCHIHANIKDNTHGGRRIIMRDIINERT